MRFECESCQQLAQPSEVRPAASGVLLICASCGHLTSLTPFKATSKVVTEAPPPTPAPLPVGELELTPTRVRVETGEGSERCPKCGFRQQQSASCSNCGLDHQSFALEDPPWERSPAGKDQEVLELDRRWAVLVEPEVFMVEEEREALIHYGVEHGLLDRLSRRFRFYAQDHHGTPLGDAAEVSLARIVEKMHATFMVGKGQGADYNDDVKKVKLVLYFVVSLMCLGVVVLGWVVFFPE